MDLRSCLVQGEPVSGALGGGTASARKAGKAWHNVSIHATDKLTESGHFIKKKKETYFALSSRQDVVADIARWLCVQKKGSGGAHLSNNSFLQE